MNDNLKEIGLRIAQARKKKSMSQADLAEKAQVSISHISDIENGKKQIGIEIFIRITEALNVSADWLLRASNNEVKGMSLTNCFLTVLLLNENLCSG